MRTTHFEVTCKLGKCVRITEERWQRLVTVKHPEMRGREEDLKKVLEQPDEIRRDPKNSSVYRYHRRFGDKYVRVVVKHLDTEGFIITAFPENKIGGGELVWQK